MILRPYQTAIAARALDLLRERRRVVVVLPTGAGKTVVAAAVVRNFARPTLWLAHRRELLAQARAVLPPTCIVDSVQRRKPFPAVDLVVVDEGHHSLAPTYRRHLDAHDGAALHLTATPYRLDGKGLGDVADLALWVDWPDDGPPVIREGREGDLTMTAALVREGTLVGPRYFSIPGIVVDGLKTRAGDYETQGLVAAADKPSIFGDAIREYRAHAPDARAVCFCVTVEHAEHAAAAFNAAGIPSAVVSGESPKDERDATLAALRAGTLRIVCTVAVLTEGWDLPTLEAAIILRPTTSLCLWLQMLGRVMRTADGKAGAVVLDHAGNISRHGFATDPVYFDLDGAIRRPKESLPPLTTCRHCYAIFNAGPAACPVCGKPIDDEADETQGTLDTDERGGFGDETRLVEMTPAQRQRIAYSPALWDDAVMRSSTIGAAKWRYKQSTGEWPLISADGRILDPLSEEGKKRAYFELLELATAKGWKLGAAAHKFNSRYGMMPPFEWTARYRAWKASQCPNDQ